MQPPPKRQNAYIILALGVMAAIYMVSAYTDMFHVVFPGWTRRWSYPLQAPITGGMAHAIPKRQPFAFSNNSVFFSDYHGHIYALDNKKGVLTWVFTTNNYSPYPPATDQNAVYVADFDSNVYALDIQSGEELWRFALPNMLQPDTPPFVNTSHVFVGSRDGTLYVLNKQDGSLAWTFIAGRPPQEYMPHNSRVIHFGMMTVTDTRVFINSPYRYFYILDAKSGALLQKIPLNGYSQETPIITQNTILVKNGTRSLLIVDIQTGKVLKQIKDEEKNIEAVVSFGTFTIRAAEQDDEGSLFVMDKHGVEVAHYDHVDITPSSLSSYGTTVYFASRDLRRVYAIDQRELVQTSNKSLVLKCCALSRPVPPPNMNRWYQQPTTVFLPIPHAVRKFFQRITNRDATVSAPVKLSVSPPVYEITLTHNDAPYSNPFRDVTVQVTMTHENGQEVSLEGFYYDHNTWKIRFAPPSPGKWEWNMMLHTPTRTIRRNGSLFASEKIVGTFLKIDQNSPSHIRNPDGSVFTGVGLQEALFDVNMDGDPINQWPSIRNAPFKQQGVVFTDMDTYFQTYSADKKGFNLYRLGIDNASFRLWKTIAPHENRYGIREGKWADTIILSAKKFDIRIWMTMFGFEPPYPNHISDIQKRRSIEEYVRYVVARYGAFVDVWELMNEAIVPDEWIRHITTRLRNTDPYGHPITTNWEQPQLTNVDIISTHWYDTDMPERMDIATKSHIQTKSVVRKPLVVSEVGNKNESWDKDSALRFRVRLWTSFFFDTILIFWNQVRGYYKNPDNANVYIGVAELSFVTSFRSFVASTTPGMVVSNAPVDHPEVRAYWKSNGAQWIGYLYHYLNQQTPITAVITLTLADASQLIWIDPASDTTIKTLSLEGGTHRIRTPPFRQDLAVKILKR